MHVDKCFKGEITQGHRGAVAHRQLPVTAVPFDPQAIVFLCIDAGRRKACSYVAAQRIQAKGAEIQIELRLAKAAQLTAQAPGVAPLLLPDKGMKRRQVVLEVVKEDETLQDGGIGISEFGFVGVTGFRI